MAKKTAAKSRRRIEVIELPPIKLTRGHLTARNWRDASTRDINKRIYNMRFEANQHHEDIEHLQEQLNERRKAVKLLQIDIDALEMVVESRR